MSVVKNAGNLAGYDGYIFGSPIYNLDAPEPVKEFLILGRKAGLDGKLAGAFGSYIHDGSAPMVVLDTMQHVYDM